MTSNIIFSEMEVRDDSEKLLVISLQRKGCIGIPPDMGYSFGRAVYIPEGRYVVEQMMVDRWNKIAVIESDENVKGSELKGFTCAEFAIANNLDSDELLRFHNLKKRTHCMLRTSVEDDGIQIDFGDRVLRDPKISGYDLYFGVSDYMFHGNIKFTDGTSRWRMRQIANRRIPKLVLFTFIVAYLSHIYILYLAQMHKATVLK